MKFTFATDNSRDDSASQILLQSDGKILAIGSYVTHDQHEARWGIRRFNANGSPDTGFGENGIARYAFGTEGGDVEDVGPTARSFAFTSDNAVIVAGFVEERLNRLALAKVELGGEAFLAADGQWTLIVDGTDESDDISIDINPNNASELIATRNGESLSFDLADVKRISIDAARRRR